MKVFVSLIVLSFAMLAKTQSLPELKIDSTRSFYMGFDNIFNIELNDADPAFIDLKCLGGRVNRSSDTVFRVYPQAIYTNEVKLKLYYKNLPVDIVKLPVVESPLVKVSINGKPNLTATKDQIRDLKVDIDIVDDYLGKMDFKLYSFNTDVKRGNNPISPFIVVRNNSLGPLDKYKGRLQSGDKILINDIMIYSKNGRRLKCQSNYFEILIE